MIPMWQRWIFRDSRGNEVTYPSVNPCAKRFCSVGLQADMLGSSMCPLEGGRTIHRYQFFHSRREYRSASNRFEELPHAAEFFVPLFEQRAGSEREQIPQ